MSDRRNDVHQHQHLHSAIIERNLKAYKQKMRGEVKEFDGMLQGRIVEIRHDKGFGQSQATDCRLIYFHRNAVVDGDFDALKVGDTVELMARHHESEIGPQAGTFRQISPLKYRS